MWGVSTNPRCLTFSVRRPSLALALFRPRRNLDASPSFLIGRFEVQRKGSSNSDYKTRQQASESVSHGGQTLAPSPAFAPQNPRYPRNFATVRQRDGGECSRSPPSLCLTVAKFLG